MQYQSLYDPDRETIGKIYLDAQKNNKGDKIEVGDMSNELMSSLIVDLNETITSNPYDGKPFYICVHESRDLVMKNMFKRRMLTSLKRPYPEDDTVVYYTDPKKNETLFCWCLPHWTEMDNMLNNEHLYNHDQMVEIKAWKNNDLYHFGFTKDHIGNWMPNPHYKDHPLEEYKTKIYLPSSTQLFPT